MCASSTACIGQWCITDAGRAYAEEVSAPFAKIEMATRELGRTAKSDILTVHSTPSFATQ